MFAGEEVVKAVRQTISDTLSVSAREISDEFCQDTCLQWTSLRHMTLLVSLEERFGVVFSMREMTSMVSLRDIVETLSRHGVTA